MVSLKLVATLLTLLITVGCASNMPQQYETHENYHAKVAQYRIDRVDWLDRRRIRYRTWRDAIYDPALKSVSTEQREEYEVSVQHTCGTKAGEYIIDSEYGRCRERHLSQLLVENVEAFESLDAYIDRQGGEEPKPKRPNYQLQPPPLSQHDIEYEKAMQACELLNGQWITRIHMDDWDSFENRMRCLETRPPAHDCAWLDSLLPYEIQIEYNRKSKVIIEFKQIPWEPMRSITWTDKCVGTVD